MVSEDVYVIIIERDTGFHNPTRRPLTLKCGAGFMFGIKEVDLVTNPATRHRNDWCHSPASIIAWGIPIAALILSGPLAPQWMGVIWPVSLAWMGTACVLNARRCSRVHCYITAVFFYGLAALAALYGFDVVDLGPMGWSWISGIAVVGGLTLTLVPEWVLGRYRR